MSGWDASREKRLRALWSDKKSVREIAAILNEEFAYGFTRNSIIGKAHRLGLDGRPSPIKTRSQGPRRSRPVRKALADQDPFARPSPIKARSQGPRRSRLVRSAVSEDKPLASVVQVLRMKPPVPIKAPAPEGRYTLEEVQAVDGCRWPYGHTPHMRFCGEKRESDRPYCPGHCSVAFIDAQNRAA